MAAFKEGKKLDEHERVCEISFLNGKVFQQ